MRPYDRALPIALLRAREATLRPFRAHLDGHGVTVQQWRVIRALAEGAAMTPTDLAERCVLMPPSLSRILKTLTARGLVEQVGDAADGRRKRVAIAVGGRALYDRVAGRSDEIYAELEAAFGADRMDRLLDLLVDLHRVADRMHATEGAGPEAEG